ncbi:translocation/assembly module TamB domain-containing protein [Hydrogenivirga sp.]
MRYVAFFFLLLLSLYFLLVKPYLITKRIYYDLRGVSLSFSPFSLRIGQAYLYLPLKGNYLFLRLSDFAVSYDRYPSLTLHEGALTIVETSGGKEKGKEPPALLIPEFLKDMHLCIERFLFTRAGKNTLSVLVTDLNLKERVLRGRAEILSGDTEVLVNVERVRLLEKVVSVESLSVVSESFSFRLRGSLKEGEVVAHFSLEGGLRAIDTPQVYVAPVKIAGEGRADYGGLRATLEAHTEVVQIKGRKRFSDVSASGELSLTFGKELRLYGSISNPVVEADYDLLLMPRRHLSLQVRRFPVDSELLGVDPFVLSWVRGSLELDLDEGDLSLLATTDGLSADAFNFGSTELFLEYNYNELEGTLDVAVRSPAELYMHGDLKGADFESLLDLRDLLFVSEGVSGFLSCSGALNYVGGVSVRGGGSLEDVYYMDIYLGELGFKLNLEGDRVLLSYAGEGIRGEVRGSLKSGLISATDLKGFRRSVRGYNLLVEDGKVELSLQRESLALALFIRKAYVLNGSLKVPLEGSLKLRKGKELSGSFYLKSRDAELGGRVFHESALLSGEISDLKVLGRYGIEKTLEGVYSLDLRDLSLTSSGSVKRTPLEANFRFEGTPRRGVLEVIARLKTTSDSPRLHLRASYEGKSFKVKLSPFDYRYRVAEVSVGGAEVEGNLDGGKVRLGDLTLSVLGKEALVIKQREGSFSLREGALRLSLSSSGALVGETELAYHRDGGLLVHSSGNVDLDFLSFFIASPVGGKVKGKLGYELSYEGGKLALELKNRGRVVTFSKYFAFPMDAWVELRALGKNLSAFITVWKDDSGLSANVGSTDLRNYYVYLVSRELPVAYRSPSFALRMNLSSEGWVDISDLSKVKLRLDALLSGELQIRELKGGGGKGGGTERGGSEVELDVRFDTQKPIRVSLPEGYLYVKVRGWVGGNAQNPEYAVSVEFLSGELTYFGRRFFVRGGSLSLLKEKEVEEKKIDIALVNPSEEMSIFINLRGDLDDPQLVVWSEPPRSTQEILTKLVIGSTAEGIIPVAKTLFRQLGYIGNVRSGLASLLGVDITFSTQTGSQGEIGINVNIRKKIARALSIEYQQSTLKDPRATYYGASLSLPGGTFFYGRVFADNTSELKLRFIRKFDF